MFNRATSYADYSKRFNKSSESKDDEDTRQGSRLASKSPTLQDNVGDDAAKKARKLALKRRMQALKTRTGLNEPA